MSYNMFIHQIYSVICPKTAWIMICVPARKWRKGGFTVGKICLILDGLMIQSSPSGVIPYLGKTFGSFASGPPP